MTLAFIGSIGPVEIIVILLIAIVIFGRDLPDVGRRLGKTLFQVRKGIDEIKGDFYESTADIRKEVKSTQRDLNVMLNEPPEPVAEEVEKPEPEAEETDGEPAESPDIEAEKSAEAENVKEKDSASEAGDKPTDEGS